MTRFFISVFTLVTTLTALPAGGAAQRHEDVIPLADSPDSLIVPDGTPVHFKSWNREEITAHFEGKFVLEGRFEIASWDADPIIVPDPDTAAHLPHWRDRGGPAYIFIRNSMPFEKAVLSPREIEGLRNHKTQKLAGHVAIVADHYSAAIVCDAPDYEVDFISLVRPIHVSANQQVQDAGC